VIRNVVLDIENLFSSSPIVLSSDFEKTLVSDFLKDIDSIRGGKADEKKRPD